MNAAMFCGMETNRTRHPRAIRRAIGALLDRIQEPASIIDRLMAMPLPDEAMRARMGRAVTRRLESRLAETMRAMIEPDEPERRRA